VDRQSKILSHEVYATPLFFRRFLSSFSEEVKRVVICSPAFDTLPAPFNNVIGFCNFLQQREVDKIVIITRPPGSGNAALPQETAKLLDSRGIDVVIREKPTFNSKLYHLDFHKGWFRSFIGSASFTNEGLQENQEVMAEVEGVGVSSPCYREIERLLSDKGAISLPMWINRQASGQGVKK